MVRNKIKDKKVRIYETENFCPLFDIRKADSEAFGHTAQDGGVDVVWSVGGTKNKNSVST